MTDKEKVEHGCLAIISVACVFFVIGMLFGMWIG